MGETVSNTTGINRTFKILSFFGIYIIVSAHLSDSGIPLFYGWFTPYSFHVPLFLFISGYFYKPDTPEHLGHYVLKKIKHLLVPLFIWNLIYGLFTNVLFTRYGFEFEYQMPVSLKSLFLYPIIYGHQFSMPLAAWFVVPLFTVEIGNALFRWLLRKVRLENEWLLTVLYFVVGFWGIELAKIHCQTGVGSWWLALTRFMFLLPAYQLGTLYCRKLEKHDALNSWVYFGIVFLLQFCIKLHCASTGQSMIYLASWMSEFSGSPAVTYLSILTGIAFWLRVSKILTPVLGENKLVLLIADNTYSIMTHHLLGFFTLNTLLFVLVKHTSLIKGFKVLAYNSMIMYSWDPGVSQFSLFYVIFGFAVSLLIAFISKRIVDVLLRLYRRILIDRSKTEPNGEIS